MLTVSPVNVAFPELFSDTLTVPASDEPSGPLAFAIVTCPLLTGAPLLVVTLTVMDGRATPTCPVAGCCVKVAVLAAAVPWTVMA